jgi:hypothetical protein
VSFETAMQEWEDGARRLRDAAPEQRPLLERISGRILDELRRRLGGPFTTEELVELYQAGTDWCLQLAVAAAPEDPWAWDTRTVADAAFRRYVREARDFAGGRRIEV